MNPEPSSPSGQGVPDGFKARSAPACKRFFPSFCSTMALRRERTQATAAKGPGRHGACCGERGRPSAAKCQGPGWEEGRLGAQAGPSPVARSDHLDRQDMRRPASSHCNPCTRPPYRPPTSRTIQPCLPWPRGQQTTHPAGRWREQPPQTGWWCSKPQQINRRVPAGDWLLQGGSGMPLRAHPSAGTHGRTAW